MRKITLIVGMLVLIFFLAILFLYGAEIIQKPVYKPQQTTEYIVKDIPQDGDEVFEFAGKKYKAFCQWGGKYGKYNKYLARHGCAACTTTTVVRAFSKRCSDWTPDMMIDKAEKSVFGEDIYKDNYSRPLKKQMPVTLYGINKILNHYGIKNDYVSTFESREDAEKDIIAHLKTSNPVIFTVSKKNRVTGKRDNKWTHSYHTMLMIGVTENGNVVVCDPANGNNRFKVVPIDTFLEYMWSCPNEPNTCYWTNWTRCGGYIKVGASEE